jgi:hypothetical protein
MATYSKKGWDEELAGLIAQRGIIWEHEFSKDFNPNGRWVLKKGNCDAYIYPEEVRYMSIDSLLITIFCKGCSFWIRKSGFDVYAISHKEE